MSFGRFRTLSLRRQFMPRSPHVGLGAGPRPTLTVPPLRWMRSSSKSKLAFVIGANSASRIWRMSNLFIGLPAPSSKGARRSPLKDHPTAPTTLFHRVAEYFGVGGRIRSDWAAGSRRKHRPNARDCALCHDFRNRRNSVGVEFSIHECAPKICARAFRHDLSFNRPAATVDFDRPVFDHGPPHVRGHTLARETAR